MSTYQIISTGNVILADQEFVDAIHSNDYVLLPEVSTSVVYGSKITPRAFFQRFGQVNLLWLYQQLASNPALQMYKDQVTSANYVDLSDPVTLLDLNYLLTLNATPFTTATIQSILNKPVTQNEVAS